MNFRVESSCNSFSVFNLWQFVVWFVYLFLPAFYCLGKTYITQLTLVTLCKGASLVLASTCPLLYSHHSSLSASRTLENLKHSLLIPPPAPGHPILLPTSVTSARLVPHLCRAVWYLLTVMDWLWVVIFFLTALVTIMFPARLSREEGGGFWGLEF